MIDVTWREVGTGCMCLHKVAEAGGNPPDLKTGPLQAEGGE